MKKMILLFISSLLITSVMAQDIEQKLKERAPFYDAATQILTTENLSEQTFGKLLGTLKAS